MTPRVRELMIQAGYAAPEMAGRAQELVRLVAQECLRIAEPMPGSGDIEDLALASVQDEIKELFGVEK